MDTLRTVNPYLNKHREQDRREGEGDEGVRGRGRESEGELVSE